MNKKDAGQKKRIPWFTGQGDDGMTRLPGPVRVPKYDVQPDTFGDLDEATSALGLARSLVGTKAAADAIFEIQHHLHHIMSELAATQENRETCVFAQKSHSEWLEETIACFGEQVRMPHEFVMPGNTTAGGALDLARAIVRRCERKVLRGAADGWVTNPWIARYLNRLSSLCFVLARLEDCPDPAEQVTPANDDDTYSGNRR